MEIKNELIAKRIGWIEDKARDTWWINKDSSLSDDLKLDFTMPILSVSLENALLNYGWTISTKKESNKVTCTIYKEDGGKIYQADCCSKQTALAKAMNKMVLDDKSKDTILAKINAWSVESPVHVG